MATSYTWALSSFEVEPTYQSFPNVLRACWWFLTASDGVVSATISGRADLGDPVAQGYTPFASLTRPQVEAMVEASIPGIASIKTALAARMKPAPTLQIQTRAPWGGP